MTSEQLTSNEVMFTNVTLSNSKYGVQFTKSLKRMTALYENYVTAYNNLVSISLDGSLDECIKYAILIHTQTQVIGMAKLLNQLIQVRYKI